MIIHLSVDHDGHRGADVGREQPPAERLVERLPTRPIRRRVAGVVDDQHPTHVDELGIDLIGLDVGRQDRLGPATRRHRVDDEGRFGALSARELRRRWRRQARLTAGRQCHGQGRCKRGRAAHVPTSRYHPTIMPEWSRDCTLRAHPNTHRTTRGGARRHSTRAQRPGVGNSCSTTSTSANRSPSTSARSSTSSLVKRSTS